VRVLLVALVLVLLVLALRVLVGVARGELGDRPAGVVEGSVAGVTVTVLPVGRAVAVAGLSLAFAFALPARICLGVFALVAATGGQGAAGERCQQQRR